MTPSQAFDASLTQSHFPESNTSGPLIEARGVIRNFGTTEALRGANLSVHAGEVVTLMGPSGSGKTTFLQCLAGIITPDSGTITYRGDGITSLSESRRAALRRTEFGFVFQFGQLVDELSAVENIALPLLLEKVKRSTALRRATEALAEFGLESLARRSPAELSGGQRQQVAVARALITGPKVVFADEPTGALDTLAGEAVMEALTDRARERDIAVVLVTHDLKMAAYADRLIMLRDGTTERTDDERTGLERTDAGRTDAGIVDTAPLTARAAHLRSGRSALPAGGRS